MLAIRESTAYISLDSFKRSGSGVAIVADRPLGTRGRSSIMGNPTGSYKRPPTYEESRAYCLSKSDLARSVKLFRVRNFLFRGDVRFTERQGWLICMLLEFLRQAQIEKGEFSVWPRNETLGFRMCRETRTVQRTLEELEAMDLIHRDPDDADRREICLLPLLVRAAEWDELNKAEGRAAAAAAQSAPVRAAAAPKNFSRASEAPAANSVTRQTSGDVQADTPSPYKGISSGDSGNQPTEPRSGGGRFAARLREVISGCKPLASVMEPQWQSLSAEDLVAAVGRYVPAVLGDLRTLSWAQAVEALGTEAVWRLATALEAKDVRSRAGLFVTLVRAPQVDYTALEARLAADIKTAALDAEAQAAMDALPAQVAATIAAADLSANQARGLLLALNRARFEPTNGELRVLACHDAARGIIERYGHLWASASRAMGCSSYMVETYW